MRKRLFALLAILSLVSGYAYAYDADGNPNTKREIAGAPGYIAYREYQLVRFGENAPNATALTAGDVVVWNCVSDDGVTVQLVAATNSADAAAGVVVSTTIPTADTTGTTPAIDFGRRNWGYMQTKGLCTNVNMIGTITAGVSIKASDTARNADTAATLSLGVPGRAIGFAMDTSSDAEVMLNL